MHSFPVIMGRCYLLLRGEEIIGFFFPENPLKATNLFNVSVQLYTLIGEMCSSNTKQPFTSLA